MNSLVEAILTRDTCSEACWNAHEHVCRCSCGGTNHGCMLVNGVPQPNRTRRVKDTRYRLAAVLDWMNFEDRFQYRALEYSQDFAFQAVPKDCKWTELAGIAEPYRFIWVKETISIEDTQKLLDNAKTKYLNERIEYHLKYGDCDGVTYARGTKIEGPCENPEWHKSR